MSENDDYAVRQAKMDADYLSAFESLTAEQRAELSSAGIKGPHCGRITKLARQKMAAVGLLATEDEGAGRETTCMEGDATELFANSMRASIEPARPESLADELAEKFGVTATVAEQIARWHEAELRSEAERESGLMLRRVIGFFLQPGNLRIRAHALAHAARMATSMGFDSLRASARHISATDGKVSAEGVRKVAWQCVELLGLPPLEGAKSPEACAEYSKINKENHWRNQKCTLETLTPKNTKSLKSKKPSAKEPLAP